MRLWHTLLIPHLPRQQLLGQHRECCALRGNGWGKKHVTVDYVFTHHWLYLFHYHILIMEEMRRRGYNCDSRWFLTCYRGLKCPSWDTPDYDDFFEINIKGKNYPEHNDAYLEECLSNLLSKGIDLRGKIKDECVKKN